MTDEELVAKLRRRHVCTQHNGDQPPIVTTHHLINPDGPEAADTILALARQCEGMRNLLRETQDTIRDATNGTYGFGDLWRKIDASLAALPEEVGKPSLAGQPGDEK